MTVGHVTRDANQSRWQFGGTVFYSSLTAQHLGMRVTAVTRMGAEDGDTLSVSHRGVHWLPKPSPASTVMRNTYRRGNRIQHAPVIAPPLDRADFAGLRTEFAVVHLAPIAGELSPDLLPHVPPADLTGLTGQGMLRRVGIDGRVHGQSWPDPGEFLEAIDVLVLSDEDIRIDSEGGLNHLRRVPIGVLTQGHQPVRVFSAGREFETPVRAIVGGQRTGAGDVFAATLFVALHRTGALGASSQAAATLATRWVESASAKSFPTVTDLEDALQHLQ